MYVSNNHHDMSTSNTPWNRGKLTGQKPPLKPRHVWAIRTRLQLSKKMRDLALFNVAIDSKLRGCDIVRLMIEDIAPHGCCIDRATIRQRKTGRPVKFEPPNRRVKLSTSTCRNWSHLKTGICSRA